MLPEPLRLNRRQREHEQLVEFVNHLQATVTRAAFMGDDLRPTLETITELSEGMVDFDKSYRADIAKATNTRVQPLSQLKIHRELQEAG